MAYLMTLPRTNVFELTNVKVVTRINKFKFTPLGAKVKKIYSV